ncbi:hypothetical protein [Paenibacillus macquariensis]|uniref:3-methyladenine DNA glycosylase AlkC n=1 Tax=Paenibacillus macquariensis TaxID=948756 RepID=A0ABY1K7B8_9BACL|nr:hypothetical protein [Paenibacillus macquariensis]MEC0091057.1 hypothetical protein [Paenibacillus macquariensis]OAB33754.1 hypothetical protein PMSM_14130 [Paenibacillus macquariensis subsp. macquariensis]SIR36689.1 3-methyladenine DNA glycosylase AlkC [Paenibacillus macquariensis]
MAEPLKHMYNEQFLRGFSYKLHDVYDAFDIDGFMATTLDDTWEILELKARMRRITTSLGTYLPSRYEDALEVLFKIDKSCIGFPYLFFPDFIEVYGQGEEHWEISMIAIERFTSKSSAEFAVRPFLLRDPIRMMSQMLKWAEHPQEHVRRLASEGCRPRLPWGQALPMFKHDPSPILPVLELLKADPSLYVRKSVANNLNDIVKDHPSVVIDIARRWKGKDLHTDWIVRHGCRTLIRKADPEIMSLFGYAEPTDGSHSIATYASISVATKVLSIGGACELQYELHVQDGEPAHVRIEYAIDFVKAKGNTSRKSFLLSDKTVVGGTRLQGIRKHSWRDLTTRRHYPGEHRISLLVNGREVANTLLELTEF